MPVREALRVLHGEGLVVSETNRGARVRPIHPGFVEDLFDIRSAIETMLARRAAERRSREQIARMAAFEDELEAVVRAGRLTDVPPINREFHNCINDAAGNPGAMSLVDRHWLLVAALWARYGSDDSERFARVVDDHRHLIRAIERRDSAAASILMGAHIEKAKHDLLDRMKQDAVPDAPAFGAA
jgi:DNA-binding GntR family transcriptional regulator